MRKHTKGERSVDAQFRKKMADPKFRRLYEVEDRKVRLGFLLNQLRQRAGLTQVELAMKVGVTQGYIARLETAEEANYEIKTLKKIAGALHKVVVIGFADEAKGWRSPVQRRSIQELVVC